MKRALCLSAILAVAPAFAATLTPEEREFLAMHMQRTHKLFLEATSGLNDGQWNFKPAPDRWSVAECAEHLAVAEEFIFGWIQTTVMKAPLPREWKPQTRENDQAVLAMLIDRSKRGKAPEMMIPSKRWASPADIVKAFSERRSRTVEHIRTTEDDLRAHATGRMDAYQFLVMMAGHTERHVMQMQEVKAQPGYPK